MLLQSLPQMHVFLTFRLGRGSGMWRINTFLCFHQSCKNTHSHTHSGTTFPLHLYTSVSLHTLYKGVFQMWGMSVPHSEGERAAATVRWVCVCVSIVAWWEIQSILEREEASWGTAERTEDFILSHLPHLFRPPHCVKTQLCTECHVYITPSVQIWFMRL